MRKYILALAEMLGLTPNYKEISMQKIMLPNGVYVIHKLYVDGIKSKISAWFDADGNVIDAALYDTQHRERPASQRAKDMIRAYMGSLGFHLQAYYPKG